MIRIVPLSHIGRFQHDVFALGVEICWMKSFYGNEIRAKINSSFTNCFVDLGESQYSLLHSFFVNFYSSYLSFLLRNETFLLSEFQVSFQESINLINHWIDRHFVTWHFSWKEKLLYEDTGMRLVIETWHWKNTVEQIEIELSPEITE